MYFISDWAILNDANSKQLQRILALQPLSASEIRLACILLESYHTVYRRDRLKQRSNQVKSGQAIPGCLPPTRAQLQEIARHINAKTTSRIRPEEILDYLQNLANTLQQYRFALKKGSIKTSLNKENPQGKSACTSRSPFTI